MVSFMILIVANLIVGVIAGFFLGDDKKGISLVDIKIGTIVLIAVSVIVFWRNGFQGNEAWLSILVSWVVLCVGLVYGEKLRRRWSQIISDKKIDRKRAEKAIENFLAISEKVVSKGQTFGSTALVVKTDDDEEFQQGLRYVVNEIERLKAHADALRAPKMKEQLNVLEEACISIHRIGNSCGVDDEMKLKHYFLTKEVKELSEDMLTRVETHMYSELNRRTSGAMGFPVKSYSK